LAHNEKFSGPAEVSQGFKQTALLLKIPQIAGSAGTAGWAIAEIVN